MPHEPIILDKESWPLSHSLTQHTLNRLAQNQHNDGERLQGLVLSLQKDLYQKFEDAAVEREKRRGEIDARREADFLRAESRLNAIDKELETRTSALAAKTASIETRVVIYGVVAGFIASGLFSVLLAFVTKKW